MQDTYRALDNIERLLIAIGGYNEAFKVSEEKKDVVLIFANEIVYERQTKQNVFRMLFRANNAGTPTLSNEPRCAHKSQQYNIITQYRYDGYVTLYSLYTRK